MRKLTYAVVAAVAVAALAGYLTEQRVSAKTRMRSAMTHEARTVSITGEVVGLWCYLNHGARGAAHKECAVNCVKAGNPIGLVTKTGAVYILMGAKTHQPGSAVALDKMAQTVTVTGRLVRKGGLQAIYVKEIK